MDDYDDSVDDADADAVYDDDDDDDDKDENDDCYVCSDHYIVVYITHFILLYHSLTGASHFVWMFIMKL